MELSTRRPFQESHRRRRPLVLMQAHAQATVRDGGWERAGLRLGGGGRKGGCGSGYWRLESGFGGQPAVAKRLEGNKTQAEAVGAEVTDTPRGRGGGRRQGSF